MNWISFLVTGPEASLMAWQMDAMQSIELFDRREQTVRCRAHGVDYTDIDNPAWGNVPTAEALQGQLDFAVQLAKKHHVTIQRIDGAGASETYPVLYMGPHQMRWGDSPKT